MTKFVYFLFFFFPFISFAQFKHDKLTTFSELQLAFNNWKASHDLKNEKGWKYYKRWEYDQLMHTLPNGEPVDAEMYLTEILKACEEKKILKNTSQQSAWTSIGPDTLPPSPDPYQQHGMGRINCMAFHPYDPNTYWIGVAQGGIWKTTDNGSTWVSLSDQLPILRISDIVVDPNNTDVMYISLCDFEYVDIGLDLDGRKRNTHYGMGIYKTTDGGLNWQPSGLSFTIQQGDASLIRKIIIDPNNSNNLVAAGISGMFASTDAGDNWTQVLDSMFWDLVQDPNTPSTLYAATAYLNNSQMGYASILKSIDFGQSWIELNSGIPSQATVTRIKLAIAPSDPNYIYAVCTDVDKGLYGIYKSTDAGNSWSLIYNSLNLLHWYDGYGSGGQGTYDLVLLVNPTDKNTVYVGGVNLWGSTDGGSTFNPISYWVGNHGPSIHADQHFLSYQPLSGTYFICNDGGIYKSANLLTEYWGNIYNGATWPTVWTNISNGLAITSFYRISSSKANDGRIIGGAQDNSTFYFDGSSWINVIGGDGMDNWIHTTNSNTFIGSYQYGGFEKTTDGGNSFSSLNFTNEEGEWTTPIIEDYTSGILYTGFGNVFKSENYGLSWKKISNFPIDFNSAYLPEISSIAVSSSNSNVLYVTKRVRYEYQLNAACYTTIDGGSTWQDITSGLPDSLYFTSIEVADDNSNMAWVSCAGMSDGNKVFKTEDGGLSWKNISYDLPNLPVNIIKQVPGSSLHKILIGTDLGVYLIDDSSFAWTSWSNGLPNVIVSDIEINASANKIYASTFGRGIWESSLSDVISSSVNSAYENSEFKFFPSSVKKGESVYLQIDNLFSGKVSVTVYDLSGKLIQQEVIHKASGSFFYRFNAPSKAGVYIIEALMKNSICKQKITVR